MRYTIFGKKHNEPTVYTLVTIMGPKAKEIVNKMLIEIDNAILRQWIDEPFVAIWMMRED